MLDEATADFTVSCEAKSFPSSQEFSMLQVCTNQQPLLGFNSDSVPLQVSGAASHDPGQDEGGSEERGLH